VIARLRGRLADDRGTTLAELLVVMMIIGIVVAATATLTIGFQRTNAQTVVRQDQVDAARAASERMSKTMRTAVRPNQLAPGCSTCTGDAFIAATRTSLQFYANLDNVDNQVGPSRVTYVLQSTPKDGTALVEKVQRPEDSEPGPAGYTYCPAESPTASVACKNKLTVRTLATGVVTGGPDLFQYFQNGGEPLSVPATGLTGSALTSIVQIEFRLTVQKVAATPVGSTTYIQRVTLPNAQALITDEED
jgi:prepilin-type N-terminal cleavage/methylation domain-containing protein